MTARVVAITSDSGGAGEIASSGAASLSVASSVSAPTLGARCEFLRQWGGSDTLSPNEAIMWRMERIPRGRSTGTSLHFLEGTPDWSQLREFMGWLTAQTPRLRQRVQDDGAPSQMPLWVNDPDFDLDYHLRRVRLPQDSGQEQLMSFLQGFANTPCDSCRPPWEALLIEGLGAGGSVFAVKLHHSITDGGGMIQLFQMALSRNPNERLSPPATPASASTHGQSRLLRTVREVTQVPGSLRRAGRKVFRVIGSGDQTVFGVAGNYLHSIADYAQSLATLGEAQMGAGSPLLKKRSLATRYQLFDVSLTEMKQVARTTSVSLNDVYLAMAIGGFRRYHRAFGVEASELALAFPVSTRKSDDPAGGNRFSALTYRAPLEIDDAVERIKAINQYVAKARQEPALDFVNKVMPALAVLPTSATSRLLLSYTARLDVQVSNIPGEREAVYLAGCQVQSHYVLPPRPGCASMLAMISHGDRACIALNIDPAAVIEPDLLVQSIKDEFEELRKMTEKQAR